MEENFNVSHKTFLCSFTQKILRIKITKQGENVENYFIQSIHSIQPSPISRMYDQFHSFRGQKR